MSLDADIKVTQYMIELPKRELLEQKFTKRLKRRGNGWKRKHKQ